MNTNETGMIACIDVAYVNAAYIEPEDSLVGEGVGVAACLVFENWNSPSPVSQYVARVQPVAEYVPGEFYKRELPPILKVLGLVKESIHTVIVDGYVQLGSGRDGLGAKLFEKLRQETNVVGVAKKRFVDNDVAIEVMRGDSVRPLFVTAMGMSIDEAAKHVGLMHGKHRLPTLLKQVDRVVRDAAEVGREPDE